MYFRLTSLILLVALMLVGLGIAHESHAASDQQEIANLQQTLEAGLKARLPSEFAFIARVVALVEQRRLPLVTVMSTFDWARDKNSRQPMRYFVPGLRERAAEIGVNNI